MKLSTKGRYAVMAIVDLGVVSQDQPVTLAEIAERQQISFSYLEQLFGKLRRGGLVKSVRGPGGGYMLARLPEDIRIYDIVVAVEEQLKVTRCNPNSPTGCAADGRRCLTHELWEELEHHLSIFLKGISLRDVIEKQVLGRGGLFSTRRENLVGNDPFNNDDQLSIYPNS